MSVLNFFPSRFQWVLSLTQVWEQEQEITKFRNRMTHEEKASKASEIIKNHVGFSLGAALVPLPGADLLAVSGVQLNMLRQLAKLYNIPFMDSLGKSIISAVVSGGAARLGASLIKALPGVGTFIGEMTMPVLSGASTYAFGRVVAKHFDGGGTLENFDVVRAKKQYKTEMNEGKDIATDLQKTQAAAAPPTGDEVMEKLKKLAEMREAGILSDEEFSSVKARLLEQI